MKKAFIFECADDTCLANRNGICFKNRIGNFECNSKQRKKKYVQRTKGGRNYERKT